MKKSFINNIRKLNLLSQLLIVCLISLSFMTTSFATIIKKQATIKIISGTYVGETGTAIFSYDDAKVKGTPEEKIDGIDITFNFLGETVKGKPEIILNNGKFKDVAWVAPITNEYGESFNFGFNAGFNRYQFNRPVERFITKDQSYFGYLFPNTYVDGAGRVKYSDISTGSSEATLATQVGKETPTTPAADKNSNAPVNAFTFH